MQTEQRLVQVLMKKLRRYIPTASIHDEVIWFLKQEVDERSVPPYIISHLADPIIADSASYSDQNGNFYLLIIFETGDPEPYEVWMVNDEVVPDFVKDSQLEISRYYFDHDRKHSRHYLDTVVNWTETWTCRKFHLVFERGQYVCDRKCL